MMDDYTSENGDRWAPWYKCYTAYHYIIIIGEGVKGIGNHAFSGYWIKGADVTINSKSIVKIGLNAFSSGDTSDSGVIFSNNVDFTSVKSIGEYAFYSCDFKDQDLELTSAEDVGANAFEKAKVHSVTFSKLGIVQDNLFYNSTVNSIDLPMVTDIKSGAFGTNTGSKLARLSIGSGLETIDTGGISPFEGVTLYRAYGAVIESPTVDDLKGFVFVGENGMLVKQEEMLTLTFDYGDRRIVEERHYSGNAISEPGDRPVRAGCTFLYWSEDGKTAFDFSSGMPSTDTTLKPVWSVDTYVITIQDPDDLIVMNDGVPVMSGDSVPYGTVLTVQTAAKAGCTSKVFLDGEELAGGMFTVVSDSTLSVEYTADPVEIPYDDDDDDQPCAPISVSKSSSSSGSDDVAVIAVAAVAGFFALLCAFVVFRH